MTPNNNLSVLPWYTSIDQQNARKWWVYGRIYPLFTPAGYVLPFQIIVPHVQSPNVSAIQLYDANTNTAIGSNLISSFTAAGMEVKQFAEKDIDVVVFPADSAPLGPVNNGRYYLTATINGSTYYSEIFTVLNDIQPYLKIRWWDLADFVMDAGVIVYTEPAFKNILYVKSDIAKPEYTFEDEGETRDGYFFPTKQISEKKYRFNFLASEYLLDVMRFIRMSDYVEIEYHGHTYKPDTFLITPEWENEGDVAVVEAEFDTDTVAKKLPYMAFTPPTPSEHYLSATPVSLAFAATQQSLSIAISSDIAWTLTLPAWITASASSGAGSANITLTCNVNTGASRQGNVVLSPSGVSGVPSVTIPVTQEATAEKFLNVSPSEIAFNANGQTVTVTVMSNVAWTLTVPSWVSASSLGGQNNDQITLTAARNESGSARSGQVVFSGTGVASKVIAVSQDVYVAPSLEVQPNNRTYNYQPHTFYYTVKSNGPWECVGSSAPDWLTCDSSGSGSMSGQTATLYLTQNNGNSLRSGILTFRLVNNPSVTFEVIINQEPQSQATTTYGLEFGSGYASHQFGANGGNFTPVVYGITYTNGVESNRTQLSSSALSFVRSGDDFTTRNGLMFIAADLGTNETAAKSQQWTLTWTAHNTASATLNLSQAANQKSLVSQSSDGTFPNVPATLIWDDSQVNEALAAGDTMTINPTFRFVVTRNYSYSSGSTDTETETLNLAGTVLVNGTGLSVSGSGTAFVVTYAQNTTAQGRSGSITIRQTEQNPYYPSYYYEESRNVTQAAASGIPSKLLIKHIENGETIYVETYGKTVMSNYIRWTIGTNQYVYTDLTPAVGENAFTDTLLQTVYGEIMAMVY